MSLIFLLITTVLVLPLGSFILIQYCELWLRQKVCIGHLVDKAVEGGLAPRPKQYVSCREGH